MGKESPFYPDPPHMKLSLSGICITEKEIKELCPYEATIIWN
jgi:hypothetical protein